VRVWGDFSIEAQTTFQGGSSYIIFTFINVLHAAFSYKFYLAILKATIVNVLTLVVAIVRQTWPTNSVQYLQGINFSQLTLAEKTEIKNLRPVTIDFVISQSHEAEQTYVRKFNPAIY